MDAQAPVGVDASEPPVSIILGNLGVTASNPRDLDTYAVSDQLVAVNEALESASKLREGGVPVRLYTMLDHPFHSKHRVRLEDGSVQDNRVLRHRLIDETKVPSRDRREELHWPTANFTIEPVRRILRGPLARYGFGLKQVRVMPEESLFWWMSNELTNVHPGFCTYKPGGGRQLFVAQDRGLADEFIAPRCVSIFGGAMVLAANRTFVPLSTDLPRVRVEPSSRQAALRFFYELDGTRVTKSAVEEGFSFATNAATYGLDPDKIELTVSAQMTKPHVPVVGSK